MSTTRHPTPKFLHGMNNRAKAAKMTNDKIIQHLRKMTSSCEGSDLSHCVVNRLMLILTKPDCPQNNKVFQPVE